MEFFKDKSALIFQTKTVLTEMIAEEIDQIPMAKKNKRFDFDCYKSKGSLILYLKTCIEHSPKENIE